MPLLGQPLAHTIARRLGAAVVGVVFWSEHWVPDPATFGVVVRVLFVSLGAGWGVSFWCLVLA